MVRHVTYLSIILLAITATSTPAAMVHHWKFDENTAGGNTVAADSAGGLDGAIQGAQSMPGKVGNALSFDGTDDVVTVSNFVAPRQGTIAFWINPALAKSKERILGAGGDYEVWLRSNGELKNELFDNGSTTIGTGAGALKANEWVHVATTYDNATTTVEIYLNGELRGSGAANTPSVPTETTLLFGHRGGAAAGEHYKGIMDDVRIYDHVLSEAEVKKLTSPPRFTARDPSPADGAVNEATWASLSWSPGDSAASHDVYLGESFDDVNTGAAGTFAGNQILPSQLVGIFGYPYPDGLIPGATYYWRIDEVNEAEPNSPWKGSVWSFSIPPTTAYNPSPADGGSSAGLSTKLSWTAGLGAKLHSVYFGDNYADVNATAQGATFAGTTFDPGPLQREKVYYWRVDENDGAATHRGEVWSFATLGAVGNPQPANGAANVQMNTVLAWTPSDHAASHQVYFGTDKQAMRQADTSSLDYKGVKSLGAESYDPGLLAADSTYYWRVDEVNSVNPNSPWKGLLWSFTTADFVVIEDFEDYDVGNNEIWWSWKDGLGYGAHGSEPAYAGNGTGAMVGDETTPSYTEEKIVHSGRKSMPVSYNNAQSTSKYSEVAFTLTSVRDWTAQGIAQLSLWFRGNSTNTSDRLYVALANRTGTTVAVYHENTNATQTANWTRWIIPLQTFADQGINLTDVDKIIIGLGTRGNLTIPGGAGKMYFDDIRLY